MPQREPAVLTWLRDQLARKRPGQEPVSAVHPSVAVITDSAAALPLDWTGSLPDDGRLAIVPMPVLVGDEIFGEGVDDLGESIALALAAGKPVRTSRPSPGQFERAFRSARARGFESAVSVHISGALSGTVEAALLAASRTDFPVEVIDSRTAGMAQGFGVQGALLAAASGLDRAGVAAAATAQLAAARIYFYVPSLDQLRRGGRIGAAASLLGTVFAIKPLLSVQEGRIIPLERVRSSARAVARLEELVLADIAARPAGMAKAAVHHFGNEAQAREFAGRLASGVPELSEIMVTGLPAVLAAHAGLGVLAVIVGEDRADTVV
ncbi:DegV family protein [Paenarthrobacter sp. PH39-S1]|uniref:DegV family protein n=1 Tax=Paenarthrobacter sp. PH39-S1 TaxID=3046204 RepID=UPI0024BB6E3F|nr:DegV family protein [Paenarthrobacter sp. PH39-S1]MDJ0357973.1 DegV family protein [Paenarthrobacter sp. PH39-S1]